MVKLLDDFDAQYAFIDNDGPLFWIQTDNNAPRGRLIAIDLAPPERTTGESWWRRRRTSWKRPAW